MKPITSNWLWDCQPKKADPDKLRMVLVAAARDSCQFRISKPDSTSPTALKLLSERKRKRFEVEVEVEAAVHGKGTNARDQSRGIFMIGRLIQPRYYSFFSNPPNININCLRSARDPIPILPRQTEKRISR